VRLTTNCDYAHVPDREGRILGFMLAVIRERSFVIMLGKWSRVLLVLIVAAIGFVAPILVDANHWFPRKKKYLCGR